MIPENIPPLFWVALILNTALAGWAVSQWRRPWGLPLFVVFMSVASWYLGDIWYNGMGDLQKQFSPQVINDALMQVIFFLLAFFMFSIPMAQQATRGLPGRKQRHADIIGDSTLHQEADISLSLRYAIIAWCILTFIGLARTGFRVLPVLFPPLAGYRLNPWGRGRVGGGLGFLISAAGYLSIFLSSFFGIVLVWTRRKKVRLMALSMILIAWPAFIWGRTRNTILAVMLPGMLGYAIMGRQRLVKRVLVLSALAVCLHFWFSFIVVHRNEGVVQAFQKGKASWEEIEDSRHLGLNMFEELCWINHFIDTDQYRINWGMRYFAEAVNFVPRAIWPQKPMIGIDYAKLRGQGGGSADQAGVLATISTGMIGQGVTNFGRIFGPIAAAFLMALWSSFLGRLWVQRRSVFRVGLFLLGLSLTFNMGRDITLLVVFPFIFGYFFIRWYESYRTQRVRN